ncbi:MAG: hypothetical protein AAGA56_04880 [Myxococcota bacterium]
MKGLRHAPSIHGRNHGVLAAVVAASLVACSSTPCEDAVNKLTGECEAGQGVSLQDEAAPDGVVVQCEGELECRAECILDASCDEVVDPEQDNAYGQCLARCAEEEAAQP